MKGTAAYAVNAKASPEALVEQYAPMVKRIGAHLRGRLPDTVELDDLVQVGLMALLEAARSYSPSKGASFETHASIRIRGAMLDEVRSNDWAPRSVWREQRRISGAINAVENRIGGPARPEDVAAELGVSLDEYFRVLTAAATARMSSLDYDGSWTDSDIAPAVPEDDDPARSLESVESREQIAAAIRRLPEREALLLALYYDEELNFREIGEIFGVSESRVCQIHAQALARIRANIHQSSGIGAGAGMAGGADAGEVVSS